MNPNQRDNSWWQARPVFVTGCNGFLGAWLTRALVERGAQVVGLIRDGVPDSLLISSGVAEQITIVRGDICDQPLMERVLGEYDIRTVFHLAAQALVGVANRNPVGTFEANITGTWSVLEAARRNGAVQQVLVASSDKAYGEHEHLPYSEDAPLQGRHPYDVSKSCADLISQSYAVSYGLPVGITRCGNLYGGGDLNWNRVVPGTIKAAVEGTAPVIRSDGTPLRDYLHVEDGVSAYLTFAYALANDTTLAGRAFNFGHNEPVSVLDLVREILRVSGREDLQPQVLGEAKGEIQQQYLDSSRAHDQLGWRPRYSLNEGLQHTFNWYRDYLACQS